MNNKQHIEAAKSLLRQQGRSDEEIKHFQKLATVYTEKVIGLLANNFGMLLELARKNKAKDTDALAAVSFNIGNKLDITDIEVVNIRLAMTYTAAFKERVAAEVNVDAPEDEETEPELPLGEDADLAGEVGAPCDEIGPLSGPVGGTPPTEETPTLTPERQAELDAEADKVIPDGVPVMPPVDQQVSTGEPSLPEAPPKTKDEPVEIGHF